jgi:hypothetical protein
MNNNNMADTTAATTSSTSITSTSASSSSKQHLQVRGTFTMNPQSSSTQSITHSFTYDVTPSTTDPLDTGTVDASHSFPLGSHSIFTSLSHAIDQAKDEGNRYLTELINQQRQSGADKNAANVKLSDQQKSTPSKSSVTTSADNDENEDGEEV